ncbi:hypothetical protein [Halorubrum sp. Eb13]|uniref:hypothetical protein n=1 Tax=Halorubrum sp. Eb13 TaxID=1383843 RepID=UPI000B98B037|nr:hypothetical protein [Halorubrum sp. Eb13]OYR44626.1 hypothetical protein DJ75_09060 [Halorubrum sp. Eb13]
MDRRAFLVGAGGAASALAGCTDLVTLGDGRVAKRDLPERPADPTPESVAAYVAEYEEVHAHNRHARDGASEVTVDAVATFDHAAGDEHFATAQHAGTAYYEDDGARSVGELYGRPVPYLVAPDRTLRMPVERRRVGTGASGRPPDETASPPLGVRLCNVTDDPREFVVTVVRRSAADGGGGVGGDITDESDGPVLSTTVELDPESAVELLEVTDVRGGYRVTASMEDDGVTGQGRIEVGLPSADRGPNVDVIVGESGVSAWHLPSFEGI